ncbi:MAG: DUF1800 family protein, partial [Acidimicrobiales bacterium]
MTEPLIAARDVVRPTATEAARFLEQATFGPTPALVAHVQDVGLAGFLDEQFAEPATSLPEFDQIWPGTTPVTCVGTCPRDNYTMYPLQSAFFRNAVTAPDQLRQRLFFALSQIFVTSAVDTDLRLPSRMTWYLRMLVDNAFGTYRDLLRAVTLH